MKSLELSLVICVADDIRIKDVLNSVDVFCEVLVVLNGATKEVKNIVKSFSNKGLFDLRYIEIPERNLSKARNYGMEAATYDRVVFYDSDCIIMRGALEKFYELLKKFLVVDGKVEFRKDFIQSKIISVTREIGIPGYALCPAIGINKKIKELVDNYYFDNDIRWIEDYEFNLRAKKANVEIGMIDSVVCIHDNLSFKQDIKSAYRYGTGVKIAVKKKLYERGPDANWGVIPQIMKKSIISGLYYIVWNIVYCVGFFFG